MEVQVKSYYEDKVGSRWIDIHQSACIAIENFFSKVLFEHDLKRMVYSAQDAVFRKRIELLDQGKVENQEYSPVSLNLPFGSYFKTTDWDDDDRVAAKQTGQVLRGQYDLSVYRRIRSRAVKATYTATFFFSTQTDVRAAAQMLNWEATPKGPICIYDAVAWKGNTLLVPINITIEKVDSKPQYNELDWLEKQRIFPIEVTMTVRSYEVLINKCSACYLPFRWKHIEPDGDPIYLTHETDLIFALDKFSLNHNIEEVNLKDDEISKSAVLYFDREGGEFSEEELKSLAAKLPNEYTLDLLKGYFDESPETALTEYYYDRNLSTPTTARLNFKIDEGYYQWFSKMKILVPSHGEIEITDCHQTTLDISGLTPHSKYECKILVYSNKGDIITYNLAFTTLKDPEDETPTPTKINSVGGLVGLHI